MKKRVSRWIGGALIAAMLLALLPVVQPVQVQAVTQNQQNIVDRADYFYDTTWVCQKTIMAWRDETTFEAGQTYRLPYAQPVNSGQFIGYGVTLEDFLAAAADVNSVFYSRQSEFNGWTSAYYGTDCAAFVAMCWGTVRQDCSTLPYFSTKIGVVSAANLSKIQLGDALDSTTVGHVVLVTDLIYDDRGELLQIEITEQTPPQLKRTLFTPEELVEKYEKEFYIYRYYGEVPEAPVRGYITECQALAAYCDIRITADATPIMSLPCESDINADSNQLGTANAGDTFVATKLYKNTDGALWYRVSLSRKVEGYIPAGNTAYQGQIISDITLADATAPAAHVRGKTFAVNGSIGSLYNGLTNASVYIYSGFGIGGTPVTGGKDVVSSNGYSLKNSAIDYDTSFGTIGVGQYTYAISVEYQNYYATGNTTYEKNTGKVDLMEEYFLVLNSAVNQSTCAHSFTTTQLSQSTCTEEGLSVRWCGTCGLVNKDSLDAKGHEYGQWTADKAASCTEDGAQSRTCEVCGDVQNEVVPAKGHDYEAVFYATDCQSYAHTTYTCVFCGDSYNTYADEIMSAWQTELPDIDPALTESKLQYRYRDLEVTTSSEITEGWTAVGHSWSAGEQGTVNYVKEWPSGFDQSNALYAAYNNIGNKVVAAETEDSKISVESDGVVGYLYYHWCSASDWYHYSYANKTNTHTTFHAYYSEVSPDTYVCDTSDMSYHTRNSCCANGNSEWFFVVKVYRQSYTTHQKQYTLERWGEWSDWSDEDPVETQTRQVESRNVYRYVDAEYGDHDYVEGVCSVCGDVVKQVAPTILPSYATVSFEGQIQLNIYYEVQDLGALGLENMGLLVWDESKPDGTIEDAMEVVSGAVTDGTQFMVHTNGIPAKNLGDTVYFKIYAQLADGSYVYTEQFSTSPKKYAMGILSKEDADAKIKSLCVAMLNYGAAAQEYFAYKTDSLMNAELTDEQFDLADGYDGAMMDAVVKAAPEKTINFLRSTEAFANMYPTVSFEGAFAINYYFVNNLTPDEGMTLYFWDAKTYESVDVLTAENATGAMEMVCDGSRYWGEVANIAAKEMDRTVYVAGVYTADGVTYSTGVIAYSLGSYCEGIAENPNSDAQMLAAETAVYGYYAKAYFS